MSTGSFQSGTVSEKACQTRNREVELEDYGLCANDTVDPTRGILEGVRERVKVKGRIKYPKSTRVYRKENKRDVFSMIDH